MKKNVVSVFVIFSILFLRIASAADVDLACEGCGELEYTQSALLAAPYGGSVLVYDITNGNLREFLVIMIEQGDGSPLGWFAQPTNPSQDDWDYFLSLSQVKSKIVGPSLEPFCGPGNGFGEFVVPDINILVDVVACQIHDACYANGGSESDREQCDVEFRDRLRLFTNLFIAEFYYRAVRIFGYSSFSYFPWAQLPDCVHFSLCEFEVVFIDF